MQHNVTYPEGKDLVKKAYGNSTPPMTPLNSTQSSDIKLNYSNCPYDPDVRKLLDKKKFDDANKLLNDRQVYIC